MRELQKDGAAPAEQDDALGVDAAREDGIGSGSRWLRFRRHDPVPRLPPDAGPLPLDLVSGRVLRCHIQPATPKIASPSAPLRIRLQPLGWSGRQHFAVGLDRFAIGQLGRPRPLTTLGHGNPTGEKRKRLRRARRTLLRVVHLFAIEAHARGTQLHEISVPKASGQGWARPLLSGDYLPGD